MKLVSFPYRWMPSTVWKNILHIYYDFKNGIGNLITFFEAVWWFRSWDWTGMIELLEVSAREMRKCQEHGMHVRAERDARQLLIVETMCKRLRANEYFSNAGYGDGGVEWQLLTDFERSRVAKHSSYMSDQDARYLGKMMRFVQHWWD